jgi:predicted AlkP superfamily phosphohydrolase/phosphomutase
VTRAVLFGLDGATFTVLDDLVRRGVMPYLGEFTREGARATLISNVPPLTPSAWSTLVTGRTPGHHGITGFFQFVSPGSLTVQVASSRQLCCETIWSMVNRHGLRAGSLNFVAHQPPPRIDGYVIPGWTPWRWLRRFSHPAGLIEKLTSELPTFDVKELAMDFDQERKSLAGMAEEDYETWIDLHIRRDRQWFSLLRHQLTRDPCELTAIVFDGVDKLQHLLWPYLDPSMQPVKPTTAFQRIRGLVLEYFREIDGFLRETVEICGPDAAVFVVSDHGFTGTGQTLSINTWLEQEGYLVWKPESDGSEREEPYFHRLQAFDMSRTRAFALASSSNGVYIPVRGRNSAEGVAPEEYETFRRDLANAILTRCVDPKTREPLVTRVWTREEVFAGPHMELAPDLTLTLRDHGFFSVRRSDSVLTKRATVMGTHHPEGVLIAHGPGIRRGATIDPVRLVDIAPTVLHTMDVPVPCDLEGHIVEELFTSERAAVRTRVGDRTAAVAAADDAPLDEEDSGILEKLKALGYIE